MDLKKKGKSSLTENDAFTLHREQALVSFRLGSCSQISKISISSDSCSARETGKLKGPTGKASSSPPLGELQLQRCRPFIEQKLAHSSLAQFHLKVRALFPTPKKKWIKIKWKSEEKKIILSLKNWAARIPDIMVWKPQSMQKSELLKVNISLCSALFGAKNKERGKKQHMIHSVILGIYVYAYWN